MKINTSINAITKIGFPRCYFNPNRNNKSPIINKKKKEYKIEKIVDVYA